MKRGLRYILLLAVIQISADSCMEEELGCNDPLAINYNPNATSNDGSCVYEQISITPESSVVIDSQISQSSGLIWWDDELWTHNDDGPSVLYELDPLDGSVKQSYSIGPGENNDWEDIAQDQEYIYVGAFGNNASGNRTDLHILKAEKIGLRNGAPKIDTIWFSYEGQDLSVSPPNQTDFDCEAFVVSKDSIYLFTKQWLSGGTTVFRVPKNAGRFEAKRVDSFPVEGMVTGATWLESEKLVVLCGYNILLQPFMYLLYDFDSNRFFTGNIRKLSLSLPYHQVEGIATKNGQNFYLTNELFENPLIGTHSQKLHNLELGAFLEVYLESR